MKLIFTLLFTTISLLATEHPIKLEFNKKGKDKFVFNVLAPKGYAVQKDAPNRIKLSSEDKLKISSPELKLTGKTYVDKPEYFEKVDEAPVTINGKGKLSVQAKIFYCDLNKNVCYPATIKQEETIK
jgi:hypothetical protein